MKTIADVEPLVTPPRFGNLVVIFAPKGVVGLWRDWLARLSEADSARSLEAKLRTQP